MKKSVLAEITYLSTEKTYQDINLLKNGELGELESKDREALSDMQLKLTRLESIIIGKKTVKAYEEVSTRAMEIRDSYLIIWSKYYRKNY